jgi:solute carrier family 25 carnitine/acylcarnitine transporter 20/29
MEPQEILEHEGGGALRTIKDLSAGAAGGVAQVLLGM